jgi:hypothetical protein
MDPKAAMDTANVLADQFRRDYLVASVVVLIVSHAVVNWFWSRAFIRMTEKLTLAQEARVVDQKEDKAELAGHLDKASTAVEMFLDDARRRAKARRSTDPKP